jgi:hypothetical protein
MILSYTIIGIDKLLLYKHILLFKKYMIIYLKILILNRHNRLYIHGQFDLNSCLTISSLAPLKKKITVLRSPHIFKKSKEHFLQLLYRYNLYLNLTNILFHPNFVKFIITKFTIFFLNYYSMGFFIKLYFKFTICYKFI